MKQTINYKPNNYLISNDASLSQQTYSTFRRCKGCNQRRKKFNEIHQICHLCYKARTVMQSGNKVIDDFIRFTLTNRSIGYGRMKFFPYDRFKDLEFIAEGGLRKV